jgi:uncharacterized protein YwgA
MVLNPPLDNVSASDEDKLLYLINSNSTNGTLYGRKKLTKLGFFAEHWSPEEDLLTPHQRLGSFDFIIYNYGPFSKQLFEAFDKLKETGLIMEKRQPRGNSQIDVTQKGRYQIQQIETYLSVDEKEQFKKVEEALSDKSGYKLEQMSLNYLGIDETEKPEYMGTSVDSLISQSI